MSRAVNMPGLKKSRAAVKTKGAGKIAEAQLREPEYDLVECLEEHYYPPSDETNKGKTRKTKDGEGVGMKFEAVMTVRVIPQITMSVYESVYAQEIAEAQRRRFSMAAVATFLLHMGLSRLQADHDVAAYRSARKDAITASYRDPRVKVELRQWMKSCSFLAPATYGGCEDTKIRTTTFVSNLAGALATELGVRKYSLVAACLAHEVARLRVSDAEHDALEEQYEALVDEIAVRRKELAQRVKTAKKRK